MTDEGRNQPSLWRNRAFLVLWVGQTTSRVGDRVYAIALPWLVLDLTGSPVQMGLTMAVDFLPPLLLGLLVGVVVDRFDRRRLMILCDAGRTLLTIVVPLLLWSGHLRTWHILALQFTMSSLGVLFEPAYLALVPGMVRPRQLIQANSALQSTATATRIFGPALAGLAIATLGAGPSLLLDSLSFAASVASLLALRVSSSLERPQQKVTAWEDIREGVTFLVRHSTVLGIQILLLAVNFGLGPVLALRVYFAREVIGLSAQGTGLVYTLGGVGAVTGSLLAAAVGHRLSRAAVITGGGVGLGVAILLMGFSRTFIAFGAAEFLLLGATIFINVHSLAYLQEIVPQGLLGRVWGSATVMTRLILPLSMGGASMLVSRLGAPPLFVAGGACTLLAAVAVYLAWFRGAAGGAGVEDGGERAAQSADGEGSGEPCQVARRTRAGPTTT